MVIIIIIITVITMIVIIVIIISIITAIIIVGCAGAREQGVEDALAGLGSGPERLLWIARGVLHLIIHFFGR